MPFDTMGNYTGGYMMTPMEDEEERRRRLMAQASGSKPTPIKETITIDPVTGERKIKIEGSERDLSALNTRTPTISMPGGTNLAPDLSRVQPQPQPQPMPQAQPPAAPVSPDQFRYENLTPDQIASLEQQMGAMGINDRGILRRPDAAEMFNQRPMDQRQQVFAASQGSMQRTAAPGAAPQPAVAPVAPTAEQLPAAPATQPLGTGITAPGTAPAAAPAAEPDYMSLLQGSQVNEKVRNRLITDPATPPDVRRAALSNERASLQEQKDRTAAQQQAQEIMAKGDGLAFAREMKKEGSLLKAMLLGAFGANDMARNELNKLGYGGTWQTVFDQQGNRAMVKVRQDGLPMEGFDQSGRALNAEEMGRFAIGGMQAGQLDIVGGTYVNDQTGEVGRMVTDKRTGRTFVQTDAGLKPMTGFRPQSSAGSLGDQRNRMIQELNLKLVGKSAEEAMAILRPYNQALAGQGLPIIQPSEVGIQAPQIGGGTSAPAAPAAQPAAPVAPGAMPQPTTPAAAPTAAPVAPGAEPSAMPQLSATMPELRPSVSTAAPAGGRPTLTEIQASAAGQEAESKSFVDYKDKEILPKAETGGRLASIRRDQISGPDGVLNNPEIAGLLSGTGSQSREFANLFRDIVAGKFENEADMSARVKATGLTDRMKEVLQIQLQRQREVTPLLIREVAPVGAITDFEQRMAKEAGIDVLRQGLYATLTNLTRSQFQSDMSAYKAVWAQQNPQYRTRAEFDRAWNQEKARLDAAYRKVYEDRAKYLGRYNRDGKNNNATVVAFRDHYPVPQFDQQTGQWQFRGFSQNAQSNTQRPPLSTFERR